MAKGRLDTPPLLCLLWSWVIVIAIRSKLREFGSQNKVLKESLGKFYIFLHKQRNGNKDSDMTSESDTLHMASGSRALSLLHTRVLGFRTRQCTERSFLSNLTSPMSLKQTATSTAQAPEPDQSHLPQVLKMLWPLSRLTDALQGVCAVGCV